MDTGKAHHIICRWLYWSSTLKLHGKQLLFPRLLLTQAAWAQEPLRQTRIFLPLRSGLLVLMTAEELLCWSIGTPCSPRALILQKNIRTQMLILIVHHFLQPLYFVDFFPPLSPRLSLPTPNQSHPLSPYCTSNSYHKSLANSK